MGLQRVRHDWATKRACVHTYTHLGRTHLPVQQMAETGLIPGSGRSSGWGGHANPLQYSCLENPTDRGTWWVTVHGVTRVQH